MVGGVTLHEALTLRVTQDGTFTTRTLGEEDAQAGEAGRVELEELHIFQGDAAAERDAHAITGEGVRVGRGLEDLAGAAGGEHHGLGLEDVQFTGGEVVGNHAGNTLLLVRGFRLRVLRLLRRSAGQGRSTRCRTQRCA